MYPLLCQVVTNTTATVVLGILSAMTVLSGSVPNYGYAKYAPIHKLRQIALSVTMVPTVA